MVGSGSATHARSDPTGLRLVVMSDRRLFREALAASLEAEVGCTVTGHAASIEDALLLCRLCAPDAVLMDVGRSPRYVTMSPRRLAELVALARVVVVYEHLSSDEASALRRQGVEAHVPMSRSLGTLLDQLRDTGPRCGDPPHGLTTLEQSVLGHLSDGHTADTLARSLGISVTAVTNAKRRVYRKMNVASQSQAVALARALGIVTTPSPMTGTSPALTPREYDILRSIALGHTVRQTARYLGIAAKTVENTQSRLFCKLGARSRVTALAAAHDQGLIELIRRTPEPEPPGGRV